MSDREDEIEEEVEAEEEPVEEEAAEASDPPAEESSGAGSAASSSSKGSSASSSDGEAAQAARWARSVCSVKFADGPAQAAFVSSYEGKLCVITSLVKGDAMLKGDPVAIFGDSTAKLELESFYAWSINYGCSLAAVRPPVGVEPAVLPTKAVTLAVGDALTIVLPPVAGQHYVMKQTVAKMDKDTATFAPYAGFYGPSADGAPVFRGDALVGVYTNGKVLNIWPFASHLNKIMIKNQPKKKASAAAAGTAASKSSKGKGSKASGGKGKGSKASKASKASKDKGSKGSKGKASKSSKQDSMKAGKASKASSRPVQAGTGAGARPPSRK